tara:strand:+ start:47 stop:304 length:258 start_codon:yes stop_codon:yes gene_type:complete
MDTFKRLRYVTRLGTNVIRPNFCIEGEIGSVRIDGIEVDNRAQHHLDKGARILMATPGGGGYGRAVDRKVAHKLEDKILGYMTEE